MGYGVCFHQAKFQPRPPHKTKAEKLEEVLDQIKNRVTVSEENLGRILEDKKKIKEEYPEVPALLKEVSCHDNRKDLNQPSLNLSN